MVARIDHAGGHCHLRREVEHRLRVARRLYERRFVADVKRSSMPACPPSQQRSQRGGAPLEGRHPSAATRIQLWRQDMTAIRTASTFCAALFMTAMLIGAASQPLIG